MKAPPGSIRAHQPARDGERAPAPTTHRPPSQKPRPHHNPSPSAFSPPSPPPPPPTTFTRPAEILAYMQSRISGPNEQAFVCATKLNSTKTSASVVFFEEIGEHAGPMEITIDSRIYQSLIDRAIAGGATLLILAHTHPTIDGIEDTTPSGADYETSDGEAAQAHLSGLAVADYVLTQHASTSITNSARWARNPRLSIMMHELGM